MKKTTAIFALAALAGCTQSNGNAFETQSTRKQQEQLRTIVMQTMMLGQRPGGYKFFPNNTQYVLDRSGPKYDLVIKMDETRKTKNDKPYLCANFRVLIITIDKHGDYILPYQRSVVNNIAGNVTSYQYADKILHDFKPQTLLNFEPMITEKNQPNLPYYLSDNKQEVCAPLSPGP